MYLIKIYTKCTYYAVHIYLILVIIYTRKTDSFSQSSIYLQKQAGVFREMSQTEKRFLEMQLSPTPALQHLASQSCPC